LNGLLKRLTQGAVLCDYKQQNTDDDILMEVAGYRSVRERRTVQSGYGSCLYLMWACRLCCRRRRNATPCQMSEQQGRNAVRGRTDCVHVCCWIFRNTNQHDFGTL